MKRFSAILATALLLFSGISQGQVPLALSTASQAVKFGPFVDSTDGNTEKTALSLANTDMLCSKNGGTLTAKNSGGGTHDANGWYTFTFDATDTNTAGRLTCFVHKTGALPVFREFTVGPVSVNATQVGGQTASASGTVTFPNATLASTTNITSATGVDVTKWNGTTVATPDTAGYPKITIKNGTGTGELSLSSGTVTTGTNNDKTGYTVSTVSDKTGYSVSTVSSGALSEASYATTAGSFWPLEIVDQGTAQAATATTLQLRSAAAFADSELVGAKACITGGSSAVGECRTITGYVGSTDTATVATWNATPSGTITYKIYGGAPGAGGAVSIAAGGISSSSFASGAIDSNAIATDAIGAAQIAANAIGASEIASNAITSSKIAANAFTDAAFDTTAGTFYAQGVIDQGTAQSVTATTIQLRNAASFADGEPVGATVLITGGTTGVGQSRIITAYTGSTDTATVANWTTTPTGSIQYKVFGTAPGSSGSVSIAAGGITASSFASGAIDANAIAANAIGNSELASGAIDNTKFASGAITSTVLAANAIGSSQIATDAIGSAQIAAGAIGSSEIAANAIGASQIATGALTNAKFAANAIDATVLATDAIGAAQIAANAIGSSELATTAAQKISSQIASDQQVISGTCTAGGTTTCTDATNLVQGNAADLQDRMACFTDGWCGLITTFNAVTHVITFTKTAPATRNALAYTIYPATAQ